MEEALIVQKLYRLTKACDEYLGENEFHICGDSLWAPDLGAASTICLVHPASGVLCENCASRHFSRAHAGTDGHFLACDLCGANGVVDLVSRLVEPDGDGGFHAWKPNPRGDSGAFHLELRRTLMQQVVVCASCKAVVEASERARRALN